MASDSSDDTVPQLDLDSETKNQQRVHEIGEARSMARNQLTQTQPGNQDDEEVLWRMLEAYILEVKPELQGTALAKPYLEEKELGNLTQASIQGMFAADVTVIDSNVGTVNGLLEYLEIGPRGIQLTLSRPGNSRASGNVEDIVRIAPPRHISRNALEATNQAFSELGYKLSHSEIDVYPDPV